MTADQIYYCTDVIGIWRHPAFIYGKRISDAHLTVIQILPGGRIGHTTWHSLS